jgi:hypothetical protein
MWTYTWIWRWFVCIYTYKTPKRLGQTYIRYLCVYDVSIVSMTEKTWCNRRQNQIFMIYVARVRRLKAETQTSPRLYVYYVTSIQCKYVHKHTHQYIGVCVMQTMTRWDIHKILLCSCCILASTIEEACYNQQQNIIQTAKNHVHVCSMSRIISYIVCSMLCTCALV